MKVLQKRLDQMLFGEWGVVVAFEGGLGMVRRLEAMGLRRGTPIRLLASQPLGGPVVIEVAGTRIVLGRGIAKRVIVQTCSATKDT
ncbi:MAG: ferrous iron transport protein A [Planctomycetota bacterium]|nr:MAG: ferrous iron transport protein A [Planctomycetota bacterium]